MIRCPDDKHLARLLEEQLDRDEQDVIEKHLEGCGQCQDALEELTRSRVSYSSTWRPWAEEPPSSPGEANSRSSFDGLGSTFLRELERRAGRPGILRPCRPPMQRPTPRARPVNCPGSRGMRSSAGWGRGGWGSSTGPGSAGSTA